MRWPIVGMQRIIKIPFANRFVLFWLLVISGSNVLNAQEQADVHPYLTEKFFIDLGIFFPDRETRLGVDGVLTGINEDWEFDQATGIEDKDETFSMDFGWRFGKKWSLLM